MYILQYIRKLQFHTLRALVEKMCFPCFSANDLYLSIDNNIITIGLCIFRENGSKSTRRRIYSLFIHQHFIT